MLIEENLEIYKSMVKKIKIIHNSTSDNTLVIFSLKYGPM